MNHSQSHSEFKELANLPNESTLEINVTHNQLTDINTGPDEIVALSPTRYEEGSSTDATEPFGKGYDITFSDASEIVFQHKCPEKIVVRGRDNKNKRHWLQYDIDLLQVINLAVQYDPRQAFLALPAVYNSKELATALDRTVFIDVWDIFARLKQQRIITDYVLVEHLPNQDPLSRPRFDVEGQISGVEYYQYPQKIRGKAKSSSWGMDLAGEDPYYDVTLGDHPLAPAQPWETILNAFRKDTYGLPITSVSRPDGGENPHEEWFDIEISGRYSSQYRNHLKRKYALHCYASGSEEVETSRIEDWILTDLDRRYNQAVEEEMLSMPLTEENISGVERNQGEVVQDYLQSLAEVKDPIGHRTEQSRRVVHQTGDRTEEKVRV